VELLRKEKIVRIEGHIIKWVLQQLEQEPTWDGDNIIVWAKIILPADEDGIVHELRFGNRIELAGQALEAYWGESRERGTRHRSNFFWGPARVAFTEARSWAEEEIKKLERAIKAREKAREN